MTDAATPGTRGRRLFPGWRWVTVALGFPIAGYIGWMVGGRVDAVDAALVGGALTGAGVGAVQWWAAEGALGRPAAWICATAAGFAVGLTVGAALVGYDTDLGSLVVMGLVTGAALGVAQGLVLALEGRDRLAIPWAVAMPLLVGLGWCASTGIGVDVDDQFTVFGAAGSTLFMLLSGLLLARFTAAGGQAPTNAVDRLTVGRASDFFGPPPGDTIPLPARDHGGTHRVVPGRESSL